MTKEMELVEKKIWDCNSLRVAAGTTGYCGGDSGHGGKTIVEIEDLGSTDISFEHIDEWKKNKNFFDRGLLRITLGGDAELYTFVKGLSFILRVLKSHSNKRYPVTSENIKTRKDVKKKRHIVKCACPGCDKTFRQKRTDQIYHSLKCGRKANYLKRCGKANDVPVNIIKNKVVLYKKVCPLCNKHFTTKFENKIYHSRKCVKRAANLDFSEKIKGLNKITEYAGEKKAKFPFYTKSMGGFIDKSLNIEENKCFLCGKPAIGYFTLSKDRALRLIFVCDFCKEKYPAEEIVKLNLDRFENMENKTVKYIC